MTGCVVCLAGKRGSGKSTIAAELASISFARTAFGAFVRSIATSRGLAHDVPQLEALGNELIAEMGWDRFCGEVLATVETADRVVVDGVRHCAAWTAIQRIVAPRPTILIFVDIAEEVRVRRLRERGRLGDDPHAVESFEDLLWLRGRADLVVDGGGGHPARQIVAWIATRWPESI